MQDQVLGTTKIKKWKKAVGKEKRDMILGDYKSGGEHKESKSCRTWATRSLDKVECPREEDYLE